MADCHIRNRFRHFPASYRGLVRGCRDLAIFIKENRVKLRHQHYTYKSNMNIMIKQERLNPIDLTLTSI